MPINRLMIWSILAIGAVTAWSLLRIISNERQRHIDGIHAQIRMEAEKAAAAKAVIPSV